MMPKNYLFDNVVLIDDTMIDLAIGKQIIPNQKISANVTDFISSVDALTYIKQLSEKDTPSAIFVDRNMPSINGTEFLEELLKLPNKKLNVIPIFLVTADILTSEEIANINKYHGNVIYLTKPISLKEIKKLTQI